MRKTCWCLVGSISVVCLITRCHVVLAEPSPAVDDLDRSRTAQISESPVAEQLTSVSQLADVQPTDWAFQALQSLIERYGAIAGYPDRTYLGNHPLSRDEFAAGLSATLDRINALIGTGLSGQVFREDLVTIARLQREYATELLALQVRGNGLETRSAELTANQFSPTTKLTGQAIFAINGGGFGGDRLLSPTGTEITDDDPSTTALYRAALDFDASFFGTDRLKIRLDTGSNGANDHAAGVLEPNFGSGLEFAVKPPRDGEFGIGRLHYTFTPLADLNVTLGPVLMPTDYVDRNSYANISWRDFSTQALVNNYILFPINDQSSGAAIAWNPQAGSFTLRALYVAAAAADPNNQGTVTGLSPLTSLLYAEAGGDRGLFGDPNQATVELEYAPSDTFTLRLQYSGGNVFDNRFDVFGANVELALTRRLGVFGRYGYGSFADTTFGDITPNYWMAGVAFRDLLVPGNVAGIAVGQPLIDPAVGNATQTNIELYYNFPLSDRLQIAPLVQVITNPANQGENGTIITGTLRTVLSF